MELVLSNLFSNKLKMSTREIAEVTGKRHDHVKRDVDVMFKELELNAPDFGVIYLDSMNRQRVEYVLDANLTLTLMTGYNTKLRNAIITRWEQLENQTVSIQEQINKICAKENIDSHLGSFHGKGLAERKKTKKANKNIFQNLVSQAQLTLGFGK